MRIQHLRFIFTLVLCSFLLACSTQKSKDDVTAIGKLYHNTTAQYNGYFNADVLMQESIKNLETQVSDNYLGVLPIYKYAEAENPMAEASSLDNAIEKVTVVVSLHRVSDWTDDCYLLMGKAQYLKKDYSASMETLEFLADEYSPSAMDKRERDADAVKKGKGKKVKSKKRKRRKKNNRRRKKKRRRKSSSKKKKSSSSKSKSAQSKKDSSSTKKKEEEPTGPIGMISLSKNIGKVEESQEKSVLKNAPAYYEGMYWLSRNYVDMARYSEATRIMDQLVRSTACPQEVKELVPLQMAYMFSKKKDYENAIKYMIEAAEFEDDKFERARLLFIVGQMYKKTGNNSKAHGYFNEVVDMHPLYELEFNASLLSAQTKPGGSGSAVIKKLEGMLKEEKNLDYKDQIYFALAEVYLNQKDKEKGIEYLEQSLSSTSRNPLQRAESAYRLANLYFEDQNYVDAKSYYDETLSSMPQKDERYTKVKLLAESLDGIADALNEITLQDSLIRIAKMSEDEKLKLAQKIKDDEEAKRLAALKEKANSKVSTTAIGKSNFYAYDSKSVKRGIRDFEDKWGSRPLEDNWRRIGALGIGASQVVDINTPIDTKVTEEEMEKMFKDVPKDEAQIAAAERKIASSMLELGKLYRADLKEPKKSVDILTKLLNDFNPTNKTNMVAHYYIYLSYLDLNDKVKAQKYYDLIMEKFPNSPVSIAINNPNEKDQQSKEQLVNNYYEDCYDSFKAGAFQETLDMIAKVPGKFGSKHVHNARFGLLKAFCIGKLKGRDVYVRELETFLIKYPNTPEEIQVRELLRILGSKAGEEVPLASGDTSKYIEEFEKVHYVILAFEDKSISVTDSRNSISNFNAEFYKSARLRSSSISLGKNDDKTPIIVVRRFNNKEKAQSYIATLNQNGEEFMKGFEFKVYAVSQSNYRTILKDKSLDTYPAFFEEHYQ